LRSGDLTNLEPFLDALSARDFENAAEILDDLAAQLESLTSPIVARELEQVAAAAGEFEPTLARKLDEAAMAILQGDQTAARSNLSDAADVVRGSGSQDTVSSQSTTLAAEITASQERLRSASSAAGPLAGLGELPGGSDGSGSFQDGQDQTAGVGQGAGDGNGNQASGQTEESGPPSNNAENQPGNGGLEAYERIYAPSNLGGEDGPQIVLPNSGPTGDVIQGQSSGSAPEPELSRVPYVDVFATYAAVYRQAIEAGQVPPHLRDIVRKYFTSLAPD
jgi:hypothetical protein